MSDNITLPRKHINYAVHALEHFNKDAPNQLVFEIVHHLRAALAAPSLAVTVDPRLTPAEAAAISSALAAPRPEPEKRHPGYVIGNHWLETAYERLCAGESEDAILEDYEVVREPRLRDLRRGAERYRWLLKWLVWRGLLSLERCRIDSPASYGDWWILRKPKVIDGSSLIGYGETEDAAIDAAMDASTAPSGAPKEPATEPAIREKGEVPR